MLDPTKCFQSIFDEFLTMYVYIYLSCPIFILYLLILGDRHITSSLCLKTYHLFSMPLDILPLLYAFLYYIRSDTFIVTYVSLFSLSSGYMIVLLYAFLYYIRSDTFIVTYVSLFSLSSGYMIVLLYEYAAKGKSQHYHISNINIRI